MSLAELENQELNDGGLTPANYATVLTHYLLAGDSINAKFLWKRIPIAAKTANDEIEAVWGLGKALWSKDFRGFFALVKLRQWTETIAPLVTELANNTRQRVFRLTSLAYTAIRASDFAAMIDLNPEDAVRLATNAENAHSCRWCYDSTSQMLEKPWSTTVESSVGGANGGPAENADQHQRQFQTLTNYVSFLEN